MHTIAPIPYAYYSTRDKDRKLTVWNPVQWDSPYILICTLNNIKVAH